jgi:tRNA threonylcarbamoyladenosine biosynthesis protein TsaE
MRSKKKVLTFQSDSSQMTMNLGRAFAAYFQAGDIVCLFGDLGSGKTTFVKGVAKGLKVPHKKVHSPSFTLMNVYPGKLPVYHIDLYRLEDPQHILGLGYEEFVYGEGIALVEWPERFGPFMPSEYIKIEFQHIDQDHRRIQVSTVGKRYQEFFYHIQKDKVELK